MTRGWATGEAEPPHETDPGSFVPLNDDEADASASTPGADEFAHASLVFTGSHEQSGWMLDFPGDKLKLYEQRRDESTGALTLHEVRRNVAQSPPDGPVVNLRIEGLELARDVSLEAYLLPPEAADSTAPQEPEGPPQDEVKLGIVQFEVITWDPITGEERLADDVQYSSEPRPEVVLNVEQAALNAAGDLVVSVSGTVRDLLSGIAENAADRVQELTIYANGYPIRVVPDLPSRSSAGEELKGTRPFSWST